MQRYSKLQALTFDETNSIPLNGALFMQSVPIDTRGAVQRFIAHWKPDIGT
jgi:3-deoxy-D-manno-octulosonic-acid transferase